MATPNDGSQTAEDVELAILIHSRILRSKTNLPAVAITANLSPKVLGAIANGSRKPCIGELGSIAQAFGTRASELVREAEDQAAESRVAS